jgi:HNH endonuclease
MRGTLLAKPDALAAIPETGIDEEGFDGSKMQPRKIRRRYVWAKTGGLCWYCGARLHRREQAATDLDKSLEFTVDHLRPRVYGGRGRDNKVPACKFCNTHKASRTVEEFREWLRTLATGWPRNAAARRLDNQLDRLWLISSDEVIFYFELTGFVGG